MKILIGGIVCEFLSMNWCDFSIDSKVWMREEFSDCLLFVVYLCWINERFFIVFYREFLVFLCYLKYNVN